jgi:hypothetical protein
MRRDEVHERRRRLPDPQPASRSTDAAHPITRLIDGPSRRV